jgi:hypothetical protein
MNTRPFVAHETFIYCPEHGEIHLLGVGPQQPVDMVIKRA